jgi:hypothetical protein
MKIENKIDSKHFKFSGYFFIALLHRHQAEHFELIFQKLWDKQIFNLYALCRSDDDEILLLTFDPFMSTSKCGKAIPNIINKFTDGKFSKTLKFDAKFSNLNQCQVRVSTFSDSIAVFKRELPNGTEIIDGHEIKIIESIAKSLNFSIDLFFREGAGQFGHVYDNGTVTNAFHDLLTNKMDITIGDYFMKANRLKFFDASISFLSYPVFFVASKGEKLTSIEKLLAPFSKTVWIFLSASFFGGIFVIYSIDLHHKICVKSQLSEKVKNPLNIFLTIIFGVTLKKLPFKNFTRVIFIIFIISFLIMRSIYQGSLYKFLQSDQRRKVPGTANGLIEEEYEFYLYDSWLEVVENDPKILKLRREVPFFNGKDRILDTIIGNHSKRASVLSRLHMNDYSTFSKSFPYTIIRENLVTVNVVQYFRKDFFLKDAIDEKLRMLITSGVIEKWISDNDFTAYWKDVKRGPRVLTLSHLCGVFYILLTAYVVSIFVFLIELYVG